MFVNYLTKAEGDRLWGALSVGGEQLQRGWLRDKCGLCWQTILNTLGVLLRDPDAAKDD